MKSQEDGENNRVSYCRFDLELAIKNIDTDIWRAMIKCNTYRMPRVVWDTAASAWINNTPESEFTAILRQAYADLKEFGYFKYIDTK